jgi:hypothetical protein
MGGSEATCTVEECIPLVVNMLEKNHGKPGLRYVDRFDKTLPWQPDIADQKCQRSQDTH